MIGTCLSLGAIQHLLIVVVVVCALVAILKVLLPRVATIGADIMRIIDIIVWAVITIAVIVVVFMILGCLLRF